MNKKELHAKYEAYKLNIKHKYEAGIMSELKYDDLLAIAALRFREKMKELNV